MIRPCDLRDIRTLYEIINDASQAYEGVIPPDCWKEPYMSEEELRHAMDEGVTFWGYEEDGNLVGVMGTQEVEDVTLIRHAYVRTRRRNQGIGGKLLTHLRRRAPSPILVGTWADALWAIRFYEKHSFRKVRPEKKDSLLRKYWSLPERQIETSVVLAESRWFESVDPSDNGSISSSGTG
ncbi:MAG: GNAT family N-acetyltransferase [candidate division NC10 bacterium]